MKIRFLNSQNAAVYRELRLQALSESSTAFASSVEQETYLTLTDFAARLETYDNCNSGIFGAFDNEERLIGMLGFSRETRPKRAHVGSLWSMYVLPEFRRLGIGSALLDSALSHALELSLRQIVLTLTANNLAASTLYRSRGFERFGFERNALLIDGIYFDREHLVLYYDI